MYVFEKHVRLQKRTCFQANITSNECQNKLCITDNGVPEIGAITDGNTFRGSMNNKTRSCRENHKVYSQN